MADEKPKPEVKPEPEVIKVKRGDRYKFLTHAGRFSAGDIATKDEIEKTEGKVNGNVEDWLSVKAIKKLTADDQE